MIDGFEQPEEGWTDPFEDEDVWVDPVDEFDEPATPVARADRAYGWVSDPTTSEERLRTVAEELATWDVDALVAEARIHDPDAEDEDIPPGERPDVIVLRRLLAHANRPADVGTSVVQGWLARPHAAPWCAMVVLADEHLTIDDDVLAAAAGRAVGVARDEHGPPWGLLLVALLGARDADAVDALLASVPLPGVILRWPDASGAGPGLPGVRAAGRRGAELLGWDGRRLPTAATILARAVRDDDERRGTTRFAPKLTLCSHGPVEVTATTAVLPNDTRGEKPYLALIVGDHPVFRMKRDWPDRATSEEGDAWSWGGQVILEGRGLGCDACRQEPDKGKRYFVTDGEEIAGIRASWVLRALELAAE